MSIKKRVILIIILLMYFVTFGCGYTEEDNPLGAGVNLNLNLNISGVVAQFDSGKVVVEWNEPDPSQTDIDYVEVYCEHSKSTNNVSCGVKNFTIENTSPSTEYNFVVTAVTKEGERKDSFNTSVKTENAPPKIKITHADVTSNALEVHWNDPTNLNFDHVELFWEITNYSGTVTSSGTENIGPGIETFNLNGLNTGQTYTYTIINVDRNGYKSEPSIFSFYLKNPELKIHFIYTAEDLNAVRGGVYPGWELDHNYYIMNDIDLTSFLSGASWVPIGHPGENTDPDYPKDPFSGTMDGNGFIIRGLRASGNDFQGLFGITNSNLINIHIRDCLVSGYTNVGALAGQLGYSGISNIFVVKNCSASGTVTGIDRYTGGLIGFNDRGASVKNCFSSVKVFGALFVGGLIGNNNNQTVENSYSLGDVNGGMVVGGLVGSAGASNIINCYSKGLVVSGGTYFVDGFIGMNGTGSTNCYFEKDVPEQFDSSFALPKTKVEMKTQATYDDDDGVDDWDFDNTWGIDSSVNGGYPYLLNNPPE